MLEIYVFRVFGFTKSRDILSDWNISMIQLKFQLDKTQYLTKRMESFDSCNNSRMTKNRKITQGLKLPKTVVSSYITTYNCYKIWSKIRVKKPSQGICPLDLFTKGVAPGPHGLMAIPMNTSVLYIIINSNKCVY